MNLHGKVAIVTGGNSGIGKAIVLALAEAGANVAIDYVCDPEATEELEKQVVALGDKAIGVDADVSKIADLENLINSTVKTLGRVDVMVNNAGIETRTSVLDTTEEQYERVLEINLKSAFFGTQLAAKQMIAQGGGGHIINVSSVHEDWPMPGNTPYCLSKGGMRTGRCFRADSYSASTRRMSCNPSSPDGSGWVSFRMQSEKYRSSGANWSRFTACFVRFLPSIVTVYSKPSAYS
jgi:NAD(P)-dependent dehydrogenase (short-subunit alcohol dehydrogenase family)